MSPVVWPTRIRFPAGLALLFLLPCLVRLLFDSLSTSDQSTNFPSRLSFPCSTWSMSSLSSLLFPFLRYIGLVPLEKDSQASHSIITPDGVFTPTRVRHGTANVVTHLQATLSEIRPDAVQPNFRYWLDDILFHRESVHGLLDWIAERFQDVCGTLPPSTA